MNYWYLLWVDIKLCIFYLYDYIMYNYYFYLIDEEEMFLEKLIFLKVCLRLYNK